MRHGFLEERTRARRRNRIIFGTIKWSFLLAVFVAIGFYAYEAGTMLAQQDAIALRKQVAALTEEVTTLQRDKSQLAAELAEVTRREAELKARYAADVPTGTISDVVRLALATDSSRFITLHLGGSGGVLPIEGVEEGYHGLSHHGRDEDKIAQLALIETEIVRAWGDFLRDLQRTEDQGGTLLDHTAVLLTSNLGNASSHDNRNMPVLFAGGRFRHGQHLAFDRQNNYPLPNLYVSVLQQTGLEHDRFATSTGTMSGLEPV